MATNAPVRPGTATTVPAYVVFPAQVTGVRRLSPNLVRITFGGAELAGMTSGGLDQRSKLLFPLPGQDAPRLPEEDPTIRAVRAMPRRLRPVPRTYTIRAYRPESHEFDIDFVVHGDTGPGSAFAQRARLGDRIGVLGPNAHCEHIDRAGGVEYDLGMLGRHTLIVGDETALPAIGSILETLPAGVRATALVEIPEAADAQSLVTSAELDIHWLPRCELGRRRGTALLEELRSMPLPSDDVYAWVSGEASMVKAARRHLVDDRGLDRRAVTFMGYWRPGTTEDPQNDRG
ncbi:siderophore-interacting protein [Haloactinomyces albus]|uniref:NADPH-dependent ferric siderophore reductase n=1 Tax=Haloactinomyces albus TaxID=1352928 RepID=A0AAE4CJQ1_9ACTN|nr:siderophore-interacting protein [Haloactinomyces albus]MDR7299934.1 NADPH-dependent ferric siderophore reductase [Haloactinomyces albus]